MVEIDRERLAGAIRLERQTTSLGTIAAQLGISRATLNRLERGLYEPQARTFMRVCAWLNRDPWDFVEEDQG